MDIWLSQGSEGVPEQDNEIACQVIWFENSSHLLTGVWSNKPRVCQDSLFFKLLYPLHLFLQNMLDSVLHRATGGELMGRPRLQSMTWGPGPDWLEHLSVLQSSAEQMVSLLADSTAPAEPPSRQVSLQRCTECRHLHLGSSIGSDSDLGQDPSPFWYSVVLSVKCSY